MLASALAFSPDWKVDSLDYRAFNRAGGGADPGKTRGARGTAAAEPVSG